MKDFSCGTPNPLEAQELQKDSERSRSDIRGVKILIKNKRTQICFSERLKSKLSFHIHIEKLNMYHYV